MITARLLVLGLCLFFYYIKIVALSLHTWHLLLIIMKTINSNFSFRQNHFFFSPCQSLLFILLFKTDFLRCLPYSFGQENNDILVRLCAKYSVSPINWYSVQFSSRKIDAQQFIWNCSLDFTLSTKKSVRNSAYVQCSVTASAFRNSYHWIVTFPCSIEEKWNSFVFF